MSKTLIDLHLHSIHSDGKLTPKQIVEKLTQSGIDFAVLTDHDTADGVKEFAQEAKKVGISTISGVEISADQDGIGIHILGYGIDITNKKLSALFKKQSAARRKAFEKYVSLFKKGGFTIDPQKYKSISNLKTISKTHVFGLIWDNPQNQRLCLKKYGLRKTAWRPQGEFINAFMTLPGQIAYVKKESIPANDAIQLIHGIGGIAVWAHPGIEIEFKKNAVLNKVFKALLSYDLDGLETFSSARKLTETRSRYLHRLTRTHNLIATIGTDDHDGMRIGTPKIPQKYHKEALKKLSKKLNIKPN